MISGNYFNHGQRDNDDAFEQYCRVEVPRAMSAAKVLSKPLDEALSKTLDFLSESGLEDVVKKIEGMSKEDQKQLIKDAKVTVRENKRANSGDSED